MNPPKKRASVILLSQYLSTGGIENMLLNHAITLQNESHWQPIVVAYNNAKFGEDLRPKFREAGIPVFLRHKGKGFSFATVLRILWIAIRHRARVLHTQDIGPLMYGGFAKILSLGWLKIIHTQHTFAYLAAEPRERIYQSYFTKLVDQLCTVSEHVKNIYFSIGVQIHSIQVVENGIRFEEKYPRSRADRLSRRKNLMCSLDQALAKQLDPNSHWLLSLGRVEENKGQARAIALWNQLPRKKNWSFIIVGPEQAPAYTEKLRALLPEDSRVVFAGGTNSPLDWYASSDLFISASAVEGLPLAPMEALASNLPTILSDIDGHARIAGYARMFPLHEERKACETIAQAMEDAEAGNFSVPVENIRAQYDSRQMTKKYAAIYDRWL